MDGFGVAGQRAVISVPVVPAWTGVFQLELDPLERLVLTSAVARRQAVNMRRPIYRDIEKDEQLTAILRSLAATIDEGGPAITLDAGQLHQAQRALVHADMEQLFCDGRERELFTGDDSSREGALERFAQDVRCRWALQRLQARIAELVRDAR